MKKLFKICSAIMLVEGSLGIIISLGILLFTQLSSLYVAVTIISILIPGVLSFLTGLFGWMKKSYHLLITLGMLSLMIKGMLSFQGYNGIIPILQYSDLIIPGAYLVLVLLINHDQINEDIVEETNENV